MKFNPHTQQLFTNEGRLIKRLNCPFRVDWSKLHEGKDVTTRRCDICQHTITDTALRTDEELLALVAENPRACLKVSVNQDNVMLTLQHEEDH